MLTGQEASIATKLRELNNQKLYSSAVQLGSMLVSACQSSLLPKNMNNLLFTSSDSVTMLSSQLISSSSCSLEELNIFCSVLFEYSVALRNDHQATRAKTYLYQTLCILQHVKSRVTTSVSTNLMLKMYEVQEQMGICCLECGSMNEAIQHFELIPLEYRSLHVNMQLGETYQKSGATQAAIQSFMCVLKMNPYSLSAIQHLIDLSGQQINEIKQLYSNVNSLFDKWIHLFVDATYARKHHKYKVAMRSYEAMNQIFPNNPDILSYIAECRARILDVNTAKDLFDKAKSIDEYVVCEFASYALLLRRMGDTEALQKLAYSMLKHSKKSPETWATLSINYEAKGQYDKALKFAQQSIELNYRYVMGYLLKANVLSILSRFPEAVTCYHEVHYFSKDIRIYQGLVNCYMSIPQLKDAKAAAMMAQKLHPHHFKSAVLMGHVLNQKSDTRDLARKEYEKAIQICHKEEECSRQIALEECILGLVDIEVRNNNLVKAIQIVRERIEEQRDAEALHIKLGELYTKAGKHTEALHHYHVALGSNPKNEIARHAIEDIEQMMQPDEDETPIGDEDHQGVDEEEYIESDPFQ
jgi:tetratricopeptide (TPR) repeat protein